MVGANSDQSRPSDLFLTYESETGSGFCPPGSTQVLHRTWIALAESYRIIRVDRAAVLLYHILTRGLDLALELELMKGDLGRPSEYQYLKRLWRDVADSTI